MLGTGGVWCVTSVQEQIPWTWVSAPATSSEGNPFAIPHLPSDGAAAAELGDKILVDVSQASCNGLMFQTD